MAKMITRTIEENIYEIMALDTLTAEVIKTEVSVFGNKTDRQVEKELKARFELDVNVKLVTFKKVRTEEQVYGMTEEQFLAMAKPVERCPSQQKKA